MCERKVPLIKPLLVVIWSIMNSWVITFLRRFCWGDFRKSEEGEEVWEIRENKAEDFNSDGAAVTQNCGMPIGKGILGHLLLRAKDEVTLTHSRSYCGEMDPWVFSFGFAWAETHLNLGINSSCQPAFITSWMPSMYGLTPPPTWWGGAGPGRQGTTTSRYWWVTEYWLGAAFYKYTISFKPHDNLMKLLLSLYR